MKKLFLFLTILSNSIFAQTPLTLEEMKAKILQNANNLSEYKQGSVFKIIKRVYQETADGKICEFESTRIDTFLLVPEQDDINPPEFYLLMEHSSKPITVEICGDLINSDTTKWINLTNPPILTLKWFANFNLENEKYFQMDNGLIFSESDSEKCYHNLKMPFLYSEIRCENNSGVFYSATKMPDANLELIYKEIKDLPIVMMYPAGPNVSSTMELPRKFGEILNEWKASKENN